ncbi:MAG: hypothetical protein IJ773_03945 [Lachnospiraceae bacterium]|nr:hypothetical protein [Acidaminococcaceae bacterium]MBQ9284653.1 hypothetical protein [Acidaminococcaceae bacterium]MBR1812954.1 hypothetical protein [Lachnospiraceae bacterium]
MANVYQFSKLSKPMQEKLLQYIASRYSKRPVFNKSVSAYGMKQTFNRMAGTKEEHITSRCFKEAMEASGFKARLLGEDRGRESNYEFNVYVLKRPR